MAKDIMNFKLPKEEGSIIKVIGVGGGGSNAVNHMFEQGILGVDFVVCNTDQQALDRSPVGRKIALGAGLTEGRGAGAQAEVGRNAAIESLDEIKAVLENNTKMVFITAGMGGGTGTGAAPVIAEAAKEMGILTVAIVTIPFGFEGRKRKLQAETGLEELKKNVDTVLVISNDKLREMYGNLKLGEAFAQADGILTIGARGIAEIITVSGYVNVDFEDVRTVMTNSGVAIMGSAHASGPDRALKAVQQALASPLLNDNNIQGAKNILLYIGSGEEEVSMDEVTEITDYIQEEAGMEADVIWGNGIDDRLHDQISITVVATGFDNTKQVEGIPDENRKKRVVHDLNADLKAAPAAAPAPIPAPAKEMPEDQPTLSEKPLLFRPSLRNLRDPEETKPNIITTSTPLEEPINSELQEPTLKSELEEPEIIRHTLEDEPTLENELTEATSEPTAELEEPTLTADLDRPTLETELPEVANELTEETTLETPEMTSELPAEEPTSSLEEMNDELEVNEQLESEEYLMDYQAPEPAAELNEEGFDTPVEPTVNEVEQPSNEIDLPVNETPAEPDPEVKKFDLFDSNETPTPTASDEPQLLNKPTSEPAANADSEDLTRMQQERFERLRNISSKFRTPASLNELENVPAYKRRNVELTDVPHSSENTVSKLTITETDEKDADGNPKTDLRSNNSFLHDSVD